MTYSERALPSKIFLSIALIVSTVAPARAAQPPADPAAFEAPATEPAPLTALEPIRLQPADSAQAVAPDSTIAQPDSLEIIPTVPVLSTPDRSIATGDPGSNPSRTALRLRGNGRPKISDAARHGLHAIAADMVHIYTAPIRMSWANAATFAGVVGVGAAMWPNDEQLYENQLDLRGNAVYDAIVDVGTVFEPIGFMGATNAYYFAGVGLGYLIDSPILRTIPAELLESHLIAGAFRQIGEIAVGRRRPNEGEGAYSFTGGTSFPSGHASVIMEVATIAAYYSHNKLAAAAAYGIAGAVCIQRVDDGQHWPSDVWLGAAYGTFVAHQIVRRNEERRRGLDQGKWYDAVKRNPQWTAMPVVAPGYVGMGLTATF